MTRYKRGEIVLVRFPYADLVRWGKRPALVLQEDAAVTELGHYIVAQISSTPRFGPARIPVLKDSEPGRSMGLLMDSTVMLDVIQTVEASLIDRSIGLCPLMDQVEKALRWLLAL